MGELKILVLASRWGHSISGGSIAYYATRAVLRRARLNAPVYAAIAVATALPIVVFMLDTAIRAQGVALLGADTGQGLVMATRLLAAMGVIVTVLQIQLLIGRLLNDRIGEFRLLICIAASPLTMLRLLFIEAFVHALIGWMFGAIIGSSALFAIELLTSNAAVPTIRVAAGMGAVLFGIIALSVLVPTLAAVQTLSRASNLAIERV